jgi:hypothetical protein
VIGWRLAHDGELREALEVDAWRNTRPRGVASSGGERWDYPSEIRLGLQPSDSYASMFVSKMQASPKAKSSVLLDLGARIPDRRSSGRESFLSCRAWADAISGLARNECLERGKDRRRRMA